MNILVINYEFPPLGGGGGVACYHIAKELAKNHNVDYLTTGFKGLAKSEMVDGINVYRVPVLGRKKTSTATILSMLTFIPSSLLKGVLLCRENKYDIINAHFIIPSGVSGFVLSKLFRVPIIMTILGGDVYDPSKKLSPHRYAILKKTIKLLLNNSDEIVAESTNMKNNIISYYTPDKQITIIPLGFTKPEFEKIKRKDLGLSDEDIILISVGRLVKRKAYQYAIQAISSLSYQNILYVIIGDGPEEINLKKLAVELNVDRKILFKGFVPEEIKFQYLSVSDIYVLSSLHEGFGICLLEAMYSGLPIVATNNGGQTDLLTDERNALLIPVENSDILAKKIEELLEDKTKRLKMSSANKTDIATFYIERVTSDYVNLYEKVINTERCE